jgi:hypothetical protein
MSEDKIIDFLVAETFNHKNPSSSHRNQGQGHFELMTQLSRMQLDMFFGSQATKGFIRFRINSLDFDIPEDWIQLNQAGYYLHNAKHDQHDFLKILNHYLQKNFDTFFVGKTQSQYLLLLWNSVDDKLIESKVFAEFTKVNQKAA